MSSFTSPSNRFHPPTKSSRYRQLTAVLLFVLVPGVWSSALGLQPKAVQPFDRATETPHLKTIAIIQDHGMLGPDLPHLGENEDQGGQLVFENDKAKALAEMGYHVVVFARKTKDKAYPNVPEKNHYEKIGKGLYEIRYIPFGPEAEKLKFVSKYRLWPHLREFAAGISANIIDSKLKVDFLMGAYAGGNQAAAMVSVNLQEASTGSDGKVRKALRHYAKGVPFSWTPHSTGAKKYDAARTNNDGLPLELETEYRYSIRRAAEAESLKAASIVTAGSSDEVAGYDHHWYKESLQAKKASKDPRLLVMKQGIGDIFDRNRKFTDSDRVMAQEFHDSWRSQIHESRHDKPAMWFWSRVNEKKNPSGMLWEYAHSPELQRRYNLVIANPDDPGCPEAKLIQNLLDVLETRIPDIRDKVAVVPVKDQKHLNSTQVGLSAMARSIIRYDPKTGKVGMEPRKRAAHNRWEYLNPAQIEPAGRMNFEFGYAGCHTASTNEGGPKDLVQHGNYLTDKGYPEQTTGLLFVPPHHPRDPASIALKDADKSLSEKEQNAKKYDQLDREWKRYATVNKAGKSTLANVMLDWSRRVEKDPGLYDRGVENAYQQVKRDMQWSVNLVPLLKMMNRIRESGSWKPVKRADVHAWFWNPNWRNRDLLGDKYPALDDTLWHRVSQALINPKTVRAVALKVSRALTTSKVNVPLDIVERRLLNELPGAHQEGLAAIAELKKSGKSQLTRHFTAVAGTTGAESGPDTSLPHLRMFRNPDLAPASTALESSGAAFFSGTVVAKRRTDAKGEDQYSWETTAATVTRRSRRGARIIGLTATRESCLGGCFPVVTEVDIGKGRMERYSTASRPRNLRNGSAPNGDKKAQPLRGRSTRSLTQ